PPGWSAGRVSIEPLANPSRAALEKRKRRLSPKTETARRTVLIRTTHRDIAGHQVKWVRQGREVISFPQKRHPEVRDADFIDYTLAGQCQGVKTATTHTHTQALIHSARPASGGKPHHVARDMTVVQSLRPRWRRDIVVTEAGETDTVSELNELELKDHVTGNNDLQNSTMSGAGHYRFCSLTDMRASALIIGARPLSNKER
ncbi:hypothetical protein BaRGS_00015148, partial [Batillaria attramentaria]